MIRLKTINSMAFLSMWLLFLSAAWGADWPDTRAYQPFICRADYSLDHHHKFLSQLAELQNEVVQKLEIAPADEWIEVYLFHDEATYRRYLKQHYPNLPFRRAFYLKEKGRGRVFAYDSPQFETDLRHECTHALLHAVLPQVPLWLDEGLATYFEIPESSRSSKGTYLTSAQWNARLGIVPNLERLEKIEEVTSFGRAEYRDAWAWIDFLLNGPLAGREELIRYLRELDEEKLPTLLSKRLTQRIPSLSSEFRTTLRRSRTSS